MECREAFSNGKCLDAEAGVRRVSPEAELTNVQLWVTHVLSFIIYICKVLLDLEHRVVLRQPDWGSPRELEDKDNY